ncbi:MAG: hypothetical protein Fur002_26650 [Anaerolineales bacterium]
MRKILLSLLLGAAISAALTQPYWGAPAYSALDKTALLLFPTAAFSFLIFSALPHLQAARFAFTAKLFGSWLAGSFVSFFIIAFLRNFYSPVFLFLLAAACASVSALSFYALAAWNPQHQLLDKVILIALFALLFSAQILFFSIAAPHSKIFHVERFILTFKETLYFALAAALSYAALGWGLFRARGINLSPLKNARPMQFARKHFIGLAFSAGFFFLYLSIASAINHPRLDTDDIFFDSDAFIWRFRLTTDQWQDFYWRSVHPLALLMLRPLVHALALPLGGDLESAATVLAALAGAGCVFLAWLFLKRALGGEVPATLIAALLGFSTTHLFYGALIETYIFLAFLMLLAFNLALRKNSSLAAWAALSAATMGMTLTNVAQTGLALISVRPRFKFLLRYVFLTLALTVTLTLVSNIFYPAANPYFFVPSTFLSERQNVWSFSNNRAQALARAFALNNFIAPAPITLEGKIPFTQFRFYLAENGKMSAYDAPLAAFMARAWLVFLAFSAFFFVKKFKQHPWSIALALMGCVAFNLILHIRYGKEFFLYSANWTYAIILLLGLAWKAPLKSRWAQLALLALAALMMVNNMDLFRVILEKTEPYFH